MFTAVVCGPDICGIRTGTRRVDDPTLGLRAIRWVIEALRHGESCTQLRPRLRQAVADEYQRRSLKRVRDWPHKKNERPLQPPRLRRLSRTENARIDLSADRQEGFS